MHPVFAGFQSLSFQQLVRFVIAAKVSSTGFLFEEELLSCYQISFSKCKAFILRLGIARLQDDVG